MLAFLITFLPIISFILWVYYKDKYNRENISILLKYFILGIILSFFAIIIEKFLIDRNIFEDDTNLIYTAFVIAGCTEEILKGLVLYIFSKKEDSYDEKLDFLCKFADEKRKKYERIKEAQDDVHSEK